MKTKVETPQDRVKAFVLTKSQSSAEIQTLITALELHRCRYPSFQEISDKIGAPKTESKLAVPGLGSQPGLGIGSLVFNSDTAEKWTKEKNKKVVLMLPFQKPDDVPGVIASVGVVTTEGGATSHAAVVTRQFGIPSVVGCSSIVLDIENKMCKIGDVIAYEGDQVIVDGTMGTVFFDLVSKGVQDQDFQDQNITVPEDIFFSFVDQIILTIQSRAIESQGAELALYCLLTYIESISDIQNLPELSASFDYLATLFSRSAKPDPIINLTVRMFKDLFQKVGLLMGATNLEALETIHQEIAKNLSRLNSIASQSVSMRHIMFCLEKATKKIDQLTSQYFERQKIGSVSQLGPRILVVEDEPYLIQPVLDALENVLNAEILLANTTEEGIAFLEASTLIDILICDIMLPVKGDISDNPYQGGISVCEKAREIRGSELPIICLSVVTDASVWNVLRKIGVDVKINKPVIISEMISIVRETLIAAHHGPKVELVEGEIKHRKLELNDSDPNVRIKALWALYQLRKYDASIFAYVQGIANTERDNKVSSVALSICTELEKSQQSSVPSKITKFTLKRQDEMAKDEELINRLDRLEGTLGKKLDNIRNGQIAIYKRINVSDQWVLERILEEVHQGRIEQGELQRTVDATGRSIKHILDSGVKIDDADIAKSLSDIYQSVNSSLTFEQQFELTLPIIPFLLDYKINLGAGVDLQAVWDELISRLKNERED